MGLLCGGLLAQTRWESSPPRFERVPGNAGLSMPVRWSLGRMQVLIEASVLPATLRTTPLHRVRLRRAPFATDPAAPARAIDCELSFGSTTATARQITRDMVANQPSGVVVVAARRTYNVPATPALGGGDAVGADLVDLPLDAPFSFAGPNLFVDWQNFAPSLVVSAGHWVDAVQIDLMGDLGLALPLGAHGCGSVGGTSTMILAPETSAPPTLGVAFPVAVRNTLPSVPGLLMASLEPLQRNPLGLPFGQELGVIGMPGCWLWAGFDLALPATSTPLGVLRGSLTLPNLVALRSSQVSVQGVSLDPGLNGLGWAVSSGLMLRPDFVGVFDRASTVLEYRASSTISPWLPFVGLTPVILFGF